ncbi:MAG: phenylalanine--tRNA ligase subunit alpha [Patescibacteria group bacterium]|jgi:phenylalanyl-tRNA synthetase alpha chain
MDSKALHTASSQLIERICSASTHKEILDLHVEVFGRNGQFNIWSKEIKNISDVSEKKNYGKLLNEIRAELERAFSDAETKLGKETVAKLPLDTSIPGLKPVVGHLHPTTVITRTLNAFFRYLGYSVYEGPEIETNEFNFEKLNLPKDHPARELADTLYISEPEVLLRTHTSSVEARAMTKEELPIRIVVPGKVYRNETTNATNGAMFYQYEGLLVDKGITMADLKGTLNALVRYLYGDDVKTRFRCKYYPQVEPGAGLDIQCTFCQGKGCLVCKYRGWIEVLGSGMVHPNELRNCGIDPAEWSGFAFGLGLDRMVMTKYGISDIRKLYSGELVFQE